MTSRSRSPAAFQHTHTHTHKYSPDPRWLYTRGYILVNVLWKSRPAKSTWRLDPPRMPLNGNSPTLFTISADTTPSATRRRRCQLINGNLDGWFAVGRLAAVPSTLDTSNSSHTTNWRSARWFDRSSAGSTPLRYARHSIIGDDRGRSNSDSAVRWSVHIGFNWWTIFPFPIWNPP